MFNEKNTDKLLPVISANTAIGTPLTDTVDVEEINEGLGYQYHQMQKYLSQQENCIDRYWRNENNKRMIADYEWSKHHSLLLDEQYLLVFNNIWRHGDMFFFQNSPSQKIISGTKEKIELEVSSRNGFNLCIVDDLNDIKEIRFKTVYLSIKSIPVTTQCIYDPDYLYGIATNRIGEIYQNDFISTQYLNKRFGNFSLDKEPSPALHFIQNITPYKNHAFLANKMGRSFKNLKSNDIMVLIGNQDVANLMIDDITTEIYGKHNVKVLNNEILATQPVEEILDKALLIKINFIPDDSRGQDKLKKLITQASIGHSRAQLFITLDEAHPFLEEFLSATDIIFLDSMQNIIIKTGAVDKIDLLRKIKFSLEVFAEELSAIGSNPLNEYDYSNGTEKQKYLNLISEIDVNGISRNDVLNPFDNSIDTAIPLDARRKHMMITGQTGSGKSELAKSLIYNDIKRNDGVVIVLEPHGDLAGEVAKLPIKKERVVYIDLTLHAGMAPSMNLFYLIHKSEKEIQARAKVIVSVVKSVNDTESFTGAMEEVLYNIVCILLRNGRSDFFDVLRYLSGKAKDLLQLGKNSPNMLEREFFMNDFENIKPTRDAVKRRIKKLLNDPLLSSLFNGDCTIDLEKLMNERGIVVVFGVKKSDMLDTYIYYVKFIIGLIQIVALKRASINEVDRVKTYCYIDEFHNFITPAIEEILTESRKYALYMTLINQSVSQIKNPALRDIVLSNTNVKLIGKNSNKTLDAMNNTLNTKLEDVEKLATGEFYLSIGNGDIVKIKNSDALLNGNANISPEEWKEFKQYQLENYYRKTIDSDSQMLDSIELSQYIDEFINAVKSKDAIYFEKLRTTNFDKYEELIYNFNDESGYIAQPELSNYFNAVHDRDYFSINRQFIDLLKSKDSLFEQNVKQNSKFKDKFRYLIG